MQARWLNLALWTGLVVPLAGCFAVHSSGEESDGGPVADAGPSEDAGALDDGGPGEDAGFVDDAGRDAGTAHDGGHDAGVCHPTSVAEAQMARVLLPDQPLAVTLRSETPSGCDCTPSVATSEGGRAFDLEACGCCRLCRCVDPRYEASAVVEAPPPGDYEITAGGMTRQLSVRRRDQCREGEIPNDLRIVGPSEGLRHGGPGLWWAVIEAEAAFCCAEPMPAVEEVSRSGGTIDLELLQCAFDPCDCVPPEPTRYEAWHSLGDLEPGRYTVTVNDALSETFEVTR